MFRHATIAAIATLCAGSGSCLAGLMKMHVNQLNISAAHGVVAQSVGSAIDLTGAIGPAQGGASVGVTLTLDFSFTGSTISGDSIACEVYLMPHHTAGVLSLSDVRLSADLYNGLDYVSSVGLESPFDASELPGAGELTSVFAITSSFKGPADAFKQIGDHGRGTFELDLLWTGATPGDTLSLEFATVEDRESSLFYLSFVPSPGPAACLGVWGVACLGRRRR